MKCLSVALTVVLLTGSVAGANCAWVLWYTYKPLVEEGTPIAYSAFETRQNCMTGLSSEMAKLEKTIRSIDSNAKVTTNAIGYQSDPQKASSFATVTFTCLPDTIDPRTKK
jgi:hypothetical protein